MFFKFKKTCVFKICFLSFIYVMFLFWLKHKRPTKLEIWCIFHGQIAFGPVFDPYHSHSFIITFSTFRSSVFTNGRFLFLTCNCAKYSLMFLCSVCFTCFYKGEKNMFLCFFAHECFLHLWWEQNTTASAMRCLISLIYYRYFDSNCVFFCYALYMCMQCPCMHRLQSMRTSAPALYACCICA